MNKPASRFPALSIALLMLAGAAPSFAQEPGASQRVEVTGTRYDVRTLCPAIEDDLRAQLARRLSSMPAQALLQVTFRLDGRHIDGVETRGSTFDARRAVRQSVQQIGCDNGSAGRQRVRFDVSFRLLDDTEPARAAQGAAVIVVAGAR
jgi:hypothetical protein